MKLHTVFVTHNRLELTKQAIASYLETVSVPHTLIVVDNASADGTREWLLQDYDFGLSLLNENHYPGYACNRGWERAPADADFLHRADNDFAFLPGWCDRVAEVFADETVGQVGLRTDEEEVFNEINVGGNCVIRRTLWNQGLRYDERLWPEFPETFSEDAFFSPEVAKMGFRWTRVKRPCIIPLADTDWNDPYYQRSLGDRRIERP